MYVQPLDTPGAGAVSPPLGNAGGNGSLFAGGTAAAAGDNVTRFVPPWFNQGAGASPQSVFTPLLGMLQQLMQMLSSLVGYGCNGSPGYGGSPGNGLGCQPYGGQQYFQNATGSSEGDPHLSFKGEHWNNMGTQPNLLNSNSIAGGFRISTQATAPNDKGVTWNRSATVTLNNGATTVSLNRAGQPEISSYGREISIAPGQTVQLGDGESVTRGQNGSLQILAQNCDGGSIQTTLSANGRGVNVDVSAHNVDLGGTLVNGYERRRDGEADGDPIPVDPPIAYNPISNPIGPPIVPPIEPQPIASSPAL
ncbi:MAG: hypothetical protein JO263_08485 [Candidatus Eremiobacteraeota bacterium]|nr:hypothetical protein [Candidatus Eremiobacteraeota bacterium]